MTKTKPDARKVDWIGLVAMTAIVVLGIFVSPQWALRAFGLWMILTAFVQQKTGRLPFGFDGAPPSARMMAALNLLVALVGFAIAAWPDTLMDIFVR